jgi:hypothetical protein
VGSREHEGRTQNPEILKTAIISPSPKLCAACPKFYISCDPCSVLRVHSLGVMVDGLGLWLVVQGYGFRVDGLGSGSLMVTGGLGFRVGDMG